MIHLQPIILLCDSAVILLRNAARLRRLKSVPRDLSFFFFADAVPVARDMLIAKQRPNLLQSPSFGLLYQSQYLLLDVASVLRYSPGKGTRLPRYNTQMAQ